MEGIRGYIDQRVCIIHLLFNLDLHQRITVNLLLKALMRHLLRIKGSEESLERYWLEWLSVGLFQGSLIGKVFHKLVFFTTCVGRIVLRREELVKLPKI